MFFFQLAQILPEERVFCRAAPLGTPDSTRMILLGPWNRKMTNKFIRKKIIQSRVLSDVGSSDMHLLFTTGDIHLWQATRLHYLADSCIVLKMSSLWDSHKAAVLWKFHFLPPTLPLLTSARYWKWGNKFHSKFYINIVLVYLWGSIKSFPVWNHGWETIMLAVSVGQVLCT